MGRRRTFGGLVALSLGSVAAAVVIRQRQDRRRPHVGLYFEDGSMVSLPDSSPQATQLLELGEQAVKAARA